MRFLARPFSRNAVRWAIAIALVGVVLSRFDLAAVAARLAAVDLFLAGPAMIGLVGIHLLGALTWRRLFDRLAGVRLPWRSTIRHYYAAQAVGAVTPGNVGADVYRMVAVDTAGRRASVAMPIVVQRATSIGALLLLGALGTLALPIAGGAPIGVSIGVVLIALAAVALLAVLADPDWQPGRLVRRLVERVGLGDDGVAGPGAWGSAVRDGLAFGLVFHAAAMVLGLVLVAAVDVAVTGRAVEVLAALAVARLSLAIPISPNGLGIQEGALGILFAQLGLAPDVALAAILLNRIALIVTVLVGGAALLVAPNVDIRARAAHG